MENKKTKKRIFKYYPEDFGDLTVKVLHMDLHFDVFDEHTVVTNDLHVETLEEIEFLDLNAKNLEILETGAYLLEKEQGAADNHNLKCSHDYQKENDILRIKFGQKIGKGKLLIIHTKTICRPTKNILEGLYYDETPKGCPCQQITQCQQWGFQRIVPCIDDMTAKCTYKTTIVADERYTNLLSNGDVRIEDAPDSEGQTGRNLQSPDGTTNIGGKRKMIKYDNIITPMATYLFFLGVGTYATFKREFEYPDGKKFMLEFLVPPDSNEKIAAKALQVLHDAIMWIYLFTGRDKYENQEQALEIKKLVEEREEIKKLLGNLEKLESSENKENLKTANQSEIFLKSLKDIREKLKKLNDGRTWGYQYTGTCYREIGMQNSDFGGMENVGNTTITTNRIMPFPEMTDGSFEYMVAVKVHEFYHNLNGSEVTGRSPFEIWLNEAVTVFIEQEYDEFLFGEKYSRLGTVLRFLAPGSGTFASDDNITSLPVEPDGFNDPNELITGVTYVKAPEFVKMIEKLMGEEVFVKGLDLYHRRYQHGNASRAQWIECMEEASGMKFQRMAQTWLKQNSYPKVYVEAEYDPEERTLTLDLEQKGFKENLNKTDNLEISDNSDDSWHWEFPFVVALCDEDGEEILDDEDYGERVFRVNNVKEQFVIKDVDQPDFLSLNRDYSLFGKVFYQGLKIKGPKISHYSEKDSSENHRLKKELYLQARKDGDLINRYMAFYQLAEQEKLKILEDLDSQPSEEFIDLYFEMLSDEKLMAEVGTSILVIFQDVEDERFKYAYEELYQTVRKIKKAIASKYRGELLKFYEKYKDLKFDGPYVEREAKYIKARSVKNSCLSLLSELDDAEVWKLIKSQYDEASAGLASQGLTNQKNGGMDYRHASDQIAAFTLYLESSAPDKMKLLEAHEKMAKNSLVMWESYLAVVAGNQSDDALKIIKKVEKSKNFRIEQANDQRALYARFAGNRRKSLLTEEGLEFLRDRIIKLAPINEFSTNYMLSVFGNINKMSPENQKSQLEVLEKVKKSLDSKKMPSVMNNLERILSSVKKK